MKKWKTTSKKREDDLNKKLKKWKTTEKKRKKKEDKLKNGRQPKMEDEPINQNQPNWL